MKKNIRYMLLIFILMLSQMGCKKWVDVNYDPNILSDENTTPDLILPNLLFTYASGASGQARLAQWMGYWTTPYDGPTNTLSTYDIISDKQFPAGSGGGRESILFEKNARRNNQPFYVGIAKFFKALTFTGYVDVLNNVPYTEAFRSDIRTPKYDLGQFIYEDCMKQLDSALILIKGAPQDKALHISTADIMFNGNKQQWYRMINTFKLRLLVHQANRPERQSYIKNEIQRIVNEGSGFLKSGEDASVNPGYTLDKPSTYFQQFSAYDQFPRTYVSVTIGLLPAYISGSANTTALEFLKTNRDPRLGFIYGPAANALPAGAIEPYPQSGNQQYRGNRFGFEINYSVYRYQEPAYVSQVGGVRAKGVSVSPSSTGIIKGFDMRDWIFTSIESKFLQAEAIQRGWLPGNAETVYLDAVKESFRWLNVGGNSANPQLSDNAFNIWYADETTRGNVNVSWAAAPDKYKLLMFQKYMAFNGIDAGESYNDYRRNGAYPDIPLSYNIKKIKNQLPIRSPYPNTEYTQNKENVEAQGPIDIFTSKIWWMP